MSTTEEQVLVCTVGSWWQDASTNPQPTDAPTIAPPAINEGKTIGLQPIGGARAQSRFSGRTAKPIFSSPPLDGAPQTTKYTSPPFPTNGSVLDAKQAHKDDWKLPSRGKTCDGSSPGPPPTLASRWRFNLSTWRWEVSDNEAANTQLMQHVIAARRWGDGRDGLAPATRRALPTASSTDDDSRQLGPKILHLEDLPALGVLQNKRRLYFGISSTL